MAGAQLLYGSIGTSHGESCTLRNAARHNLREIQRELGSNGSIDPQRTHLNEVLHGPGTATDVQALADRLMADAGATLKRKDAVQALELVFTLSPDALPDDGQFFWACLNFAVDEFGVSNILSATIHRDQGQPHMHVLVLPLVDGRMQGAALRKGAARGKLLAIFAELADGFGLTTMSSAGMSAAQRRELGRRIVDAMQRTNDPATTSPAWECVKAAIAKSPQAFAVALGLADTAPATQPKKPKRMRTMAEIFTSTGKGPKREKEPRHGRLAKVANSRNDERRTPLKKVDAEESAKTYAFAAPGSGERRTPSGGSDTENSPKSYLCTPLPFPPPSESDQDSGRYARFTCKPQRLFTGLLGSCDRPLSAAPPPPPLSDRHTAPWSTPPAAQPHSACITAPDHADRPPDALARTLTLDARDLAAASPPDHADHYETIVEPTRERDTDHAADCWDAEHGCFAGAPLRRGSSTVLGNVNRQHAGHRERDTLTARVRTDPPIRWPVGAPECTANARTIDRQGADHVSWD